MAYGVWRMYRLTRFQNFLHCALTSLAVLKFYNILSAVYRTGSVHNTLASKHSNFHAVGIRDHAVNKVTTPEHPIPLMLS